jgi:hypothetical protein
MMASRDRIAALKRARERQSRIETATTRVSRSQRRVEQSRAHRQRALEAADLKVSEAELELARQVNALVTCCGSTEYAAEILELKERDIRKMTVRAQRNGSHDDTKTSHESQRWNIER